MAQKYYNGSIRNLSYRLRKFKDVLDENLKSLIEEHWWYIVSAVTQDQLYEQGVDGNNNPILPRYALRTIKNKLKKGQPTDRVTLRDTGEFYQAFRVVADENGFYVTSTDEKTVYLTKKYGKTIFKLSNEHLKELLTRYIRPKLQERMKEYLQNG